jgi:hypothetical protein
VSQFNMETLKQELVPRLCAELARKGGGKRQARLDEQFAYDTAGALLREYIARCRARLVQLKAESQRLRHILTQTEMGDRLRKRLAAYRGHDRETTAGAAVQDHLSLATECLDLAQPIAALRRDTVLTIAGLLLFGAVDVLLVFRAMREGALGPDGQLALPVVVIVGTSLLTLLLYFIVGLFWQHRKRIAAGTVYAVTLGLLMWTLWPDYAPIVDERFGGDALDGGAGAPAWAKAALVLFMSLLYTTGGVLFIWAKLRLGDLLDEWRDRAAALAKLAQAEKLAAVDAEIDALQKHTDHVESDWAAIGRFLVRMALDEVESEAAAVLNKLRAVSGRLTASKATKDAARAEADNLTAWLKASAREQPKPAPVAANRKGGASVMALLLIAGAAGVVLPARAAELCAGTSAPSFTLMIDTSSSSPVQDWSFLEGAKREIVIKLDALPVCAKVSAFTVGDGRNIPLMFRATVLLRRVAGIGSTKAEVKRELLRFISGLPDEIKQHPQGRSELIGAWADAARNFNPSAKGNVAIMLSDGVEESAYAHCEKRACVFPKPQFSLAGADIDLFGIGLGLSQERAASLAATWSRWFAQAGVNAKAFRIARVF